MESNGSEVPAAMREYQELTITGPPGQGIRFQWLSIQSNILRIVRPPAWDEFTKYNLFNENPERKSTIKSFYPPGDFVLQTLRRAPGYYKNVMGVTMYNEGQDEFLYTLRGIWKNVKTASDKGIPFGRTLVIILVDGYKELHSAKNKPLVDALEHRYKLYSKSSVVKALKTYEALKKSWALSYKARLDEQKKQHQELHNNDPKTHRVYDVRVEDEDIVFAFESKLSLGTSDMFATTEDSRENPAFDVLFVVKAENRKKLHSHLWLFYGFCMKFNPNYVFLIDMGTEPKKKSLIALQEHFTKNPHTGGCCGEIIVKDAPWYDPLVGAQWFEYKIGHIIYKSFESLMGFIPVLPGAFSSYRWQAMKEDNFQVLQAYLLPFTDPEKLGWTLTNIYFLAEDRIMSEEIVKVGTNNYYNLRFVKGAKALTEGVDELVNFIKQRRRWINGSWFALIKVLKNCRLMSDICFKSYHPYIQKLGFFIQTLYLIGMMLLTWFSVGVFYVGFSMVVRRVFCPGVVSDTELTGSQQPYWQTDPISNTTAVPHCAYDSLTGALIGEGCRLLAPETAETDSSMMDAASSMTTACGLMLKCYIFLMALNIMASLATAPDNIKLFWKALSLIFGAVGLFIVIGMFFLVIEQDLNLYAWVTYEALGLIGVMALAIVCYWENFFTMLIFAFYYTLLMPTYINILMVYAVCKTDDVTWGTRGKDEKGSSLQDEFNLKKTIFLVFFAACNICLGGVLE